MGHGKKPLAEGNRIQYNFVKPDMALNGKTPEVSGIEIKGWRELIQKTIEQKKPW